MQQDLGDFTQSGGEVVVNTSDLNAGTHEFTASYLGRGRELQSQRGLGQSDGRQGGRVGFAQHRSLGVGLRPVGHLYRGGRVARRQRRDAHRLGGVHRQRGDDLGTVAVDANGEAILSTSTLSVGDHTITAQYNGDENCSGGSATADELVLSIGLTAYRTGGDYDQAVSQADQQSGDPSNYVIPVDDGPDPAGDGSYIDYNNTLIMNGEPVDVGNQNFARIRLDAFGPISSTMGGTISLTLSDENSGWCPDSVRLFGTDGQALTASDLNTTVGGSGYLAAIADGSVQCLDVYVEGLQADNDLTFTYKYTASSGEDVSTSVHMTVADLTAVDADGEKLTGVFYNEQLSNMLHPASAGAAETASESLDWDEFKAMIGGLPSNQVSQLEIASSTGGSYTDSLTGAINVDTGVTGSESSTFGLILGDPTHVLNGGSISDIDSTFGVNALGATGRWADLVVHSND